MKRSLSKFLSVGSGMAIGTLIYTGLLSSAHEFDFARAAFVGLFGGIAAAMWPQKK
ncbi:hypothetical protein [Duganella radicis]|uniref:Uncharacterized protein n=1 Tax=Duganella radicis TaxID=551988 RepID=A0A6L6PKJ3_9BURK|nr:hypothetical protein [Duganella radicis]MTV39590.1 hypothetical protein [Duganella radicis]